jgi:hypothetical protein
MFIAYISSDDWFIVDIVASCIRIVTYCNMGTVGNGVRFQEDIIRLIVEAFRGIVL